MFHPVRRRIQERDEDVRKAEEQLEQARVSRAAEERKLAQATGFGSITKHPVLARIGAIRGYSVFLKVKPGQNVEPSPRGREGNTYRVY